jgi:large repetitive protein
MHAQRADHSTTLLPSGKVLIAGGFGGSGTKSRPFSTGELYDPRSSCFEPAGIMTLGRSGHTAKLLKNGTMLIVGRWMGRDASRRTAEIYDPETGAFSLTGTLSEPRGQHTATILRMAKYWLLAEAPTIATGTANTRAQNSTILPLALSARLAR